MTESAAENRSSRSARAGEPSDNELVDIAGAVLEIMWEEGDEELPAEFMVGEHGCLERSRERW